MPIVVGAGGKAVGARAVLQAPQGSGEGSYLLPLFLASRSPKGGAFSARLTVGMTSPQTSLSSASSRTGESWLGCWGHRVALRPWLWVHTSPHLAPRLEYEARNQKKEAKELAFQEAMRRQEAQPEREIDCDF